MSGTSSKAETFSRWLSLQTIEAGKHGLVLLSEKDGLRDKVMEEIQEIFRWHYVSPEITGKRLASLGAPKTAALFRGYLPKTKEARSGDLGEILATELCERLLGYKVPVRRLRWKDGRNMALRGDDIVAVIAQPQKPLRFLKENPKAVYLLLLLS